MQHNIFTTMRSLKMMNGCKGTQLYALNPFGTTTTTGTGGGGGGGGGGVGEKFLHHLQDHLMANSIRTNSTRNFQIFQSDSYVNSSAVKETLAISGLPQTDLIEPDIEPNLKFVNFAEALADVYRRIEACPEFEKPGMYLEQCAIIKTLPDPKLFRRSLRSAREHAVDVHSKAVLSAWLRFERREDELIGVSAMHCCGRSMECPRSSLVSGYNPESIHVCVIGVQRKMEMLISLWKMRNVLGLLPLNPTSERKREKNSSYIRRIKVFYLNAPVESLISRF